MPRWIERDEAVRRIEAAGATACPLCDAAAADHGLTIATTEEAVVVLTPYPRFWGHLLVISRAHVLTFTDLPDATWATMNTLTLRAARLLESTLAPTRCYVASLGVARDDLPMSFPHIHLHVIPVDDDALRPADVFTWRHGVMEAEAEEWEGLAERLRAAWAAGTPG